MSGSTLTHIDYGKMGVLITALVCVTVAASLGAVDGLVAGGAFTAIIGYVIGNGALALRQKAPSPMVARVPVVPAVAVTDLSNEDGEFWVQLKAEQARKATGS